MTHRTRYFGLWIGLCFAVSIWAQGQSRPASHEIYVGVFEDDRQEVANFQPGPAETRLVRPVFQKTGSRWTTISNLDHEVTWTIAFDGRTLGTVRSRPNPAAALINSGTQSVLSTSGTFPSIGNSSEQFAGIGAIGGTKVRRPLVVVSDANFKDPDEWKRTVPSEALVALVRRAYRRNFPHVYKCDEEHPSKTDWHFRDSDMELTNIYGSNKNSFLVEIQLKNANCYIDDANDPWANQWFFVDSDKGVRRVGGFLKLLDAGDYDGDGHSEVIFFLSQPEDTDGYVLCSSDFRKKVVASWSYH